MLAKLEHFIVVSRPNVHVQCKTTVSARRLRPSSDPAKLANTETNHTIHNGRKHINGRFISWFLGAFVKLWKATISSTLTGWTLMKHDIWAFVENLSRKFKFHWNPTRITIKTFSNLCQYLAKFSLEWEMFQTKVIEKIKTHILCSVTFFENGAL